MAKKLAPLVIPAVIDTSGIDRGVNSIRSKLSRAQGGSVVGGGGGGFGGGGGAFSAGIVPYGGSGAAAAAMAAAFGSSIGQRNAPRPFIRWATNLSNVGSGRNWSQTPQPAAFKRAFPWMAQNSNMLVNLSSANATRELNLAEYKSSRADVRAMSKKILAGRDPSIDSLADMRDAYLISRERRRALYVQKRIEPFRKVSNRLNGMVGSLTDRGNAIFAGLRQSSGAMAGLGFGLTQTYQAFTKKGIQNTFSDISGLNPRDYQTAANIKRRQMTGYGTPGIMQSFFIGAERSGGMQGVRGGGSMAENAMSTVAKIIGAQFEQATTAVFSPMQFIANQFDPRKNYFNSQKRALQ